MGKTLRKPNPGNSLIEKFQEIAKEWHPTKNIDKPSDVNYSCGDQKWWICPKQHEYQSAVTSRTGQKSGCPFCSGYKTLEGFNDIQTTHTTLILEEWDYNKNIILPTTISFGSNKKVWWKCDIHNSYQQSVADKICKKRGCPKCNESKGEKQIGLILDKNDIEHKEEKQFKNCQYKRMLRFDFYLPTYNCCIEFNGAQHYQIGTGYFNDKKQFKNIQKRDKIKVKYCQKHNIKLIVIPYTEYDNIESILIKEFNIINTC